MNNFAHLVVYFYRCRDFLLIFCLRLSLFFTVREEGPGMVDSLIPHADGLEDRGFKIYIIVMSFGLVVFHSVKR